MKDTVLLKTVSGALRSGEWNDQFKFVLWFSRWLTTLQEWGTGCSCHREALGRGEKVECERKGRLLEFAFEHAMAHLEEGLRQANSWAPTAFASAGVRFCSDMQGVVRMSVLLGRQKLDFLNHIPYLLARLNEAGVKDRCVQEWRSRGPGSDNRISAEFLDEAGKLWADVNLIQPDGTGLTPVLERQRQSLVDVSFDDKVAEGPHARARWVSMHSRSSHWGWNAATMRFKQNMDDIESVLPGLDCSLQDLWNRYSSVVQTRNARYCHRMIRCTRKVFEQKLYFLHDHMNFDADDLHDDEDADDGGDHGGGDKDDLDRDGIAVPDDEIAVAADDALGIDRSSQEVKLMRDFLQKSVEPYTYISISRDLAPNCGDDPLMLFQVLDIERSNIFINKVSRLVDFQLRWSL